MEAPEHHIYKNVIRNKSLIENNRDRHLFSLIPLIGVCPYYYRGKAVITMECDKKIKRGKNE